MKIKLHVDEHRFTRKPTGGEIGGIRIRLHENHSQSSLKEIELASLIDLIRAGCTVQPCVTYSEDDLNSPSLDTNGNQKYDRTGKPLYKQDYRFISQQIFFLDIDNETEDIFDLERIGAVLSENRLCAAIVYHTFSSTPEHEKFRVCILLDEVITDETERNKIIHALFKLFGQAIDKKCTDKPRLFFGSPDSILWDEGGTCTKNSVLQLYDKLFSQPEQPEQPELPLNQNSFRFSNVPARSGGLDKTFSPDFDPDVLLDMIDPNNLEYGEWLTVSASYKFYETGTQSYDYWLNWCKGYHKDNARADKNTWNGLNGKGVTKGSLLHFAKQHSPSAYQNYVDGMNAKGRELKRNQKRVPIQENFSGNQSNANQTEDIPYIQLENQETGEIIKLPYYIYEKEDRKGNLYYAVSTGYLAKYIQQNEYYFYVSDHAFEGVRRYWYDSARGVYILVSDDHIKSIIKDHITMWERVCRQTLLKMKDVNEVFNNLITDHHRIVAETAVNGNESLINFRNGILNIESITESNKAVQMIPHTASAYSTIQLDANFHPNKKYSLDDAPTFKSYLETLTEGNQDKQQLILEFMGACLSNVPGYRFKSALFLIGKGDSGKSQIIKLLCELLGQSNCATVSFPELDDRFQSGATYGKRLIVDPDMKIMRAKSNHNFMTYTGGDPRQVEFKGLNPFTAVYNGLLLFAANELPKWGGNTTEAAYNRMIVIYCNNQIPKEKQDKKLLQKMLAEREIIIAAAIDALTTAISNGYEFTRPAECDKTLLDMKKGNSPAIDFYTSCCERLPDAETNIKHCYKCSDMYQVFVDWCKKYSHNGYTPTIRDFRKDIFDFLKSDEKQMIKIYSGTRYYKFTLTIETKNEFRPGTASAAQ